MVRPVLHFSEYNKEEIAALWYVLEDKQRIKLEIQNTLRLAKSDANFQKYARGLEKLQDNSKSRDRIRFAIQEILQEQQDQREARKQYDFAMFRKVYRPHSRAAKHRALALGKSDEDEARFASPQGPPKKKVAFDEVVMVRPILHLSDYTEEEIANSWISHADKKRIKFEIIKLMKQVKDNKENITPHQHQQRCIRGLEKVGDGGKTKERRKNPVKAILAEQEKQRAQSKASGEDFVHDTAQFREVYKSFSREARKIAQSMGKIDEAAAKTIASTSKISTGVGLRKSRSNKVLIEKNGNNSCNVVQTIGWTTHLIRPNTRSSTVHKHS